MLELLKYELKKIIMRKSARYTCIAVLVALCGIMALNVVQTKTTDNTGETLSGLDAIHYRQDSAKAHEGAITDERVSQELETYYNVSFEKIDPDELAQMSGSAAYDAINRLYDEQTVQFIYDDYFSWLIRPWAPYSGMEPTQVSALIGAHPATTLADALANTTQRTLDANMQGAWIYSEAERDFWTAKQAEVSHPLAYGFAGGWGNIIDCVAFISFSIVAICVALAPVFAGEYADRTDSVLLSSRYGRTRLVAAKISAALLFAAGYFALCALIICGVSLAAYGAGGADLPIQVLAMSSPYNLTVAQAAAISIGLAFLMTMGFAGLTLLLSSRLRSMLAVFVIDVTLVLVTGMIPSGGIGVLQHILYLFPTSLSAPGLFWMYVSYPAGGFVTDVIGAITIVYLLLIAVCTPLAAISFRRHQVA